MSSDSQEEFTLLIEKIFTMEAIQVHKPDSRLKRIHFDWLEAGEHTQRTVAGLSQQLRRYLDNQAYLENKRIMQILDIIAQKSLQIKNNLPKGDFIAIDDFGPDIKLPMERPLYTPSITIRLDSTVMEADDDSVNADALYKQQYVDKELLRDILRKELQTVSQISLSTIIKKHPLEKGLAELVTYLSIAGEDPQTLFDECTEEAIEWVDSSAIFRRAFIPRIIFNRV